MKPTCKFTQDALYIIPLEMVTDAAIHILND